MKCKVAINGSSIVVRRGSHSFLRREVGRSIASRIVFFTYQAQFGCCFIDAAAVVQPILDKLDMLRVEMPIYHFHQDIFDRLPCANTMTPMTNAVRLIEME